MTHEPIRCPAKALVMDRDNAHRGYWLAMIPASHTPDDVVKPEYFGFHRVRVGDVIEVQAEDMSWWGELLVRAIPANLNMVVTRVRFLDHFEIDDLPAGYEIKYLGVSGKHTLYFEGNPTQGGFDTREEAAIKAMQLSGSKAEQARQSQAVMAASQRKKPGPKPKSAESPTETAKAE